MNYTVTEGNYLRFGLQSVKDGVIFTFAGEKEDVCEVILYDRSLKVAGRVEAPAAFCRGAVRSVYIHGLNPYPTWINWLLSLSTQECAGSLCIKDCWKRKVG